MPKLNSRQLPSGNGRLFKPQMNTDGLSGWWLGSWAGWWIVLELMVDRPKKAVPPRMDTDGHRYGVVDG